MKTDSKKHIPHGYISKNKRSAAKQVCCGRSFIFDAEAVSTLLKALNASSISELAVFSDRTLCALLSFVYKYHYYVYHYQKSRYPYR